MRRREPDLTETVAIRTARRPAARTGSPLNGELCFAKNDDLVGPGIPSQARGADFDEDGTPDLVARYEEDPNNTTTTSRAGLLEPSRGPLRFAS